MYKRQGFALREQYPIDDNCKPIEKYGELGLFRAHEIPKITPIVVDKPGLDVACGAIGIGAVSYTHLDVYKRQGHTREL